MSYQPDYDQEIQASEHEHDVSDTEDTEKNVCHHCEKTTQEAQAYKDGWQRATADYHNLQKEVDRMRGEWARMSEQTIIEEFLPVYDNFKKAFGYTAGVISDEDILKQEVVSAFVKTQENWRKGIEYIMQQFWQVLGAHGIEEILTVDQAFDPTKHETLAEEEIEGVLPGQIIQEIDGGVHDAWQGNQGSQSNCREIVRFSIFNRYLFIYVVLLRSFVLEMHNGVYRMSLIRWTPFGDPFQDMEEMMNRLPSLMNQGSSHSFFPALDVYETKQEVVVETPLPGIDPKDVEVSVEKGVLTIQGQSKKEHEMEEKNYYRKEIRSGSFFRQVALPSPVKEDRVSAEFSEGILKISCPKSVPSVAKKVSITVLKKNNGVTKQLKK